MWWLILYWRWRHILRSFRLSNIYVTHVSQPSNKAMAERRVIEKLFWEWEVPCGSICCLLKERSTIVFIYAMFWANVVRKVYFILYITHRTYNLIRVCLAIPAGSFAGSIGNKPLPCSKWLLLHHYSCPRLCIQTVSDLEHLSERDYNWI